MEHIVMYKRYIDDLFFIWKGEKKDFDIFLANLNNNSWGLSFSGTILKQKFAYLEISGNNNIINTKTFF